MKNRPLAVLIVIAPFILAFVGMMALLFGWLWILDHLGAEVPDWN